MNNKIIGVIGGMGPQASAEFYRLLIEGARHCYGARNNDEYPEILIDSVPVPDFLADVKEMEKAALMLEDRVRRLTNFGASTITMSCNTACLLSERLQKQTDVLFISVIDQVIKEVVKKDRSVLLLASPMSLKLGLYQVKFARFGIRCAVPEQTDYKELEYIIRGVIENGDGVELMKKLVRLTERYIAVSSIDAVVLGCTELPLVFPKNFRLPVYSSLSILAEHVLKGYYTKEVL